MSQELDNLQLIYVVAETGKKGYPVAAWAEKLTLEEWRELALRRKVHGPYGTWSQANQVADDLVPEHENYCYWRD
jgi:hypothetical protein